MVEVMVGRDIETLGQIQRELKRGPKTAKKLMDKLGWSKPTIYRGIRVLQEYGAVIRLKRSPPRGDVTGVPPMVYTLVKAAKFA